MASFGNLQQVEAVNQFHWKNYRCPIDSVNGYEVTMAQPCWSAAHVQEGLEMAAPQWLENAYEFLYYQGTFYWNEPEGAVYYIPREGEQMASAEVIAPSLEVLVDSRGTASEPLHHLRFEGIAFEHATWLSPSSNVGYASVQAGYHLQGGDWAYQQPTPGNVAFAYAHDIEFQNCSFRHLGATGLVLGQGSQRNVIEGCVFEDISGGAIRIGDIEPNAGTSGNTVRNTYIAHTGQEYFDSVALFVGYADHTLIDHNEVFHTPLSGISVGWGWGMHDPTDAGFNQITNNLVHYIMQQEGMYDGGMIYTLSAQPDSAVTGNYLHDAKHDLSDLDLNDGGAIYLDQATQYFVVSGNVTASVPVWFDPQMDIEPVVTNVTATDNYFSTGAVDKCAGSLATCTDADLNNTFTDNYVFDLSSPPLEVEAVTAAAGIDPTLAPSLVPASRRIEAESYANGGEGIGYHDLSSGNQGNVYRGDDVDLFFEPAVGIALGRTNTGEWVHYLIEAHADADYELVFSAATESEDTAIYLCRRGRRYCRQYRPAEYGRPPGVSKCIGREHPHVPRHPLHSADLHG